MNWGIKILELSQEYDTIKIIRSKTVYDTIYINTLINNDRLADSIKIALKQQKNIIRVQDLQISKLESIKIEQTDLINQLKNQDSTKTELINLRFEQGLELQTKNKKLKRQRNAAIFAAVGLGVLIIIK